MKKLVSILLLLSLTLTACGKTNEEVTPSTSDEKQSQVSTSSPDDENQNQELTSSTDDIESTPVPGEYTVTFDLDYENKSFTSKSKNFKIAKPTDPTRAGYEFLGWLSPNDDGLWNFTVYEVPYDMTLTAKWGKYEYCISYSNVINGDRTNEFKKPMMSNYEANVVLEKGVAIMFNNCYSVSIGDDFINGVGVGYQNFHDSEYEVYSPELPCYFSVDSETFVVPELSFKGYTFLGWTFDGQNTPVKTVTIPKGTAKNYHLTANWEMI